VRAALAARAGGGAPSAELEFELLCSPVSELRLAAGCDVLTLVEVVEHLDPPELQRLGAVLLGRCLITHSW